MFMAMIAWFHQENTTEEVRKSPRFVGECFNDLILFFKREEGNGWELPKSHGIIQIPLFMLIFGCAANFDGKVGERSHIDHIKDNGQRTQRQMSTFLQQIGERLSEKKVLDRAADGIINQYNEDLYLLPNDSVLNRKREDYSLIHLAEDMVRLTLNDLPRTGAHFSRSFQGGYKIKVVPDDIGRATEIVWLYHNKQKQTRQMDICMEVKLAIARIALTESATEISAIGYTEAHVQFPAMTETTIVRCSEDYKGKPWYDFVAFKRGNNVLVGKVCGIVRHGEDTHMFLIHSSSPPRSTQNHFCMKELNEEFHIKITLGNINSDLLWVEVGDLISPLITFPNYGRNIKTEFVAILPRRFHGKYFSTFFRNSIFWTED
jgi:hypothetical protein